MVSAAAAAIGLVADRVAGEPPAPVHPTAAFGRAMEAVERLVYADARSRGAGYALCGVALGTAAGRLVRSTATAVGVAAAGRALRAAALDVRDALVAGDLARARSLLPALVGRDPSALDASGVAAAAVESLAENSVDAVVAPALWGAVAGAPGALGYRAVNTMDAMVGHRSARYARFGWASARCDDVANFVPARVTALLVACVRPRRARHVARAVVRDAPAHPSPNAGVAEAAFAGALGVQLGGPLRYGEREEVRPLLGDGPRPAAADVTRAAVLASHVEWACTALLAGWAAQRRLRRTGAREAR
jgi:adenosylcobinamide-phosphate synthase